MIPICSQSALLDIYNTATKFITTSFCIAALIGPLNRKTYIYLVVKLQSFMVLVMV